MARPVLARWVIAQLFGLREQSKRRRTDQHAGQRGRRGGIEHQATAHGECANVASQQLRAQVADEDFDFGEFRHGGALWVRGWVEGKWGGKLQG